jgi:peptidoglycan/LPS O-acetylase OafA/YrhL
VFFVLSGFCHRLGYRDEGRDLEEYALSRVARLYSAVLSALIATALLDHIAMAIDHSLLNHSLYRPELPPTCRDPLYAILGYVLSAVFLGESWTLVMPPGSDVPYWSVDHEAWYYVLFGVATFVQRRRRMGVLAVAGPLSALADGFVGRGGGAPRCGGN